MQIKGFSKDLRTKLAALDLERETGTITQADHDAQATILKGQEMVALGLTAADGWGYGPTAPVPDNPQGYTMVFWRA